MQAESSEYSGGGEPRQMLRVADPGPGRTATVTIGVMGVRAGSGATSLARDVVNMLFDMGCASVAAVSADRSEDLMAADLPGQTVLLSYSDMSGAVSGGDFACVVTDYGAYAEFLKGVPHRDPCGENRERLSDFLRSDISILVSGGESWETDNLRTMLRMDTVAETLRDVRIFIRPCGRMTARSIRGIATGTPAAVYTEDALTDVLRESLGQTAVSE